MEEIDTQPEIIGFSFDPLNGIVNEDDLNGEAGQPALSERTVALKVVGGPAGNDPFDTDDRENQPGDLDNKDENGQGADGDREPTTAYALITVDFKDDAPGKLAVDPALLPSKLTSDGEKISYAINPAVPGVHGNGIFAFIDSNKDGKYDDATERLVFEIHVEEYTSPSEFKVSFTLHDNIDNQAPAGLIGANEQTLDLPVKFKVTDSDGSSGFGVLPLGAVDDIPFFGEVQGSGEGLQIVLKDADITHDETFGEQPFSDDVSIFDPYVSSLGADLGDKILDAGFDVPYGKSFGGAIGAAIAQAHVSFGADGATEFDKDNSKARDSVYGALSGSGENEHPFELFMVKESTVGYPTADAHLTVADRQTNATVTWSAVGAEPAVLPVWVRQIDAQTVVGYVDVNGDAAGGETAVFVLNIDDGGQVSFFQLHQINHDVDGAFFPFPSAHDDGFSIVGIDGEPIIYIRATDQDGDHAIQHVDLRIEDDGPRFCEVDWGHDCDSLFGIGLIDEDALPHGNYGGPGDNDGGRKADGKVVFHFGTDQPGHLEIRDLTVKDSAGKTVLTLSFNAEGHPVVGGLGLFAIDNKALAFEKSGPDANGVVSWTAYIAGCPGEKVFTFSLDTKGHNIGKFDFCLHQPLEHPDTNGKPWDNNHDNGKGAWEDNFKFDFTVRGYDVDGDHADGSVKLSVDDDSPDACKVEISFCDEDNKLVHDETAGKQIGGKWFPWDHDPDASGQKEDDVWYLHSFDKFEDALHCVDAIGYAKTELKIDLSGGSSDPEAAFGADGPGKVSPVSIVNCFGKDFCGEKTNLTDTKSGLPIFLYTVQECGETFVVGRVGGKDGPISFALHVSDSGNLELAQYRAIQHPDGCDSDESLTLLDCADNALIYLQVKVTDADGDTVIARQPLDGCDGNPSIVFQDDGPTVCATDCKITLAMDESEGHGDRPYDQNQPGFWGIKDGWTPENDEILNKIAVECSGLDTCPAPIGAAADNVAKLFKVDFGTDKGCVICYELTILNDGKTNLTDTETGTCITLCTNQYGIVEGRDGCGNLVFAVWLDHDSGKIVTAQYRAIDHGDEEGGKGAHDEVKFLDDCTLGVTATAYDKDGDKDSKTVDISKGISFEDDGPVICATDCEVNLAVDESTAKHFLDIFPRDDDRDEPNGKQDGPTAENDEYPLSLVVDIFDAIFPGNVPDLIGFAHDNAEKLFKIDFGSDKGCSVCYDLTILCGDGKTNLKDTETGACITLVKHGDIVKGMAGNEVVFAIWIDADSGKLVMAQFRAIDHGDEEGKPGAHDEVACLDSGLLGVTVTATDKDGDSDCKTVDIGKGISFEDDGPVFEKVDWDRNESDDIDEDKLPEGIPGGPGDDGGDTKTSGKIKFDFGSDKPGHLEICELTVKDAAQNTVLTLSFDAQGNPVVGGPALIATPLAVSVSISLGSSGAYVV